MKEKRTEYG